MVKPMASVRVRSGRQRFLILALLVFVTTINYADRSTVAIAGPVLADQLGIGPIELGYIFSAFAWTYALGQIPGGWLLDRFGSKRVYFVSITCWSLFTMLQGSVVFLAAGSAFVSLLFLRLLVGLAEAPAFPANIRVVAAWFPAAERGIASTLFASATYFATVIWSPVMAWLVTVAGWPWMFVIMGVLGLGTAGLWQAFFHAPNAHPRVGEVELAHIRDGGGLIELDSAREADRVNISVTQALRDVLALLRTRMLLGVYIAQYCNTALAYFFLSWFPVYLVKERGMTVLQAGFSAALPALCGVTGGILGGALSDLLLRRGFSLTFSRKAPIIIGALCAATIVACNYVRADWLVLAFMSLAFFGKGLGAVGWAVISDATPPRISGLSGGVFNSFANIAGVVTTIAIGYIVAATGSFALALMFVSAHAIVAIVSYLVIVGPIRRLTLEDLRLASLHKPVLG